jgi:glycosyltransferase involved in cell wall biosynthesis
MDVYASELRKLGHRVIIVAPDYPGAAEEVDVVRLPSVPLPAYPNLRLVAPLTRGLIGRLENLKPDVIHVHSPFAVGLLGLYVSRAANCPAVFTCHSYYEEYTRYLPPLSQPLKTVVRRYLVRFCGYCQLVLAPSRHLRDFLREIGIEQPLEVLPTGVQAPSIQPLSREATKRGSRTFVMAVVGRLAKEKRVELALETVFELTHDRQTVERDRWRLLIIGDGPEADRLKRLAVELGIKSLVTFLGEIPRERVFGNLRLADCLLFPSTVETQGLVMLEAMSLGLPVVAAESPAAAEILTNGRDGLMAPPEPAEMAKAVRRLASDRVALARMGAEASKRSVDFCPQALARRLSSLYEDLMAGAGGSRPER